MERPTLSSVILLLAFIGVVALIIVVPIPQSETIAPPRGPENVGDYVGVDRCGECHEPELEAWRETQHAQRFKTMHRTPEAKAIGKALGVRRLKTEPRCVRCHYTPEEKRGKIRAGSGVSCESCHGPAAKWIELHDDFGGKEITRTNETPEHRLQRIASCRKAGMKHPSRLVELASECFGCHLVLDEGLINRTDHPFGESFEMVSWSEGEVRHRFLDSRGEKNSESAPERLRLLYVVGVLLDLEHTFRSLASANAADEFRRTLDAHREATLARFAKIRERLPDHAVLTSVQTALDAVADTVESRRFLEVAEKLRKHAIELEASPRDLAPIDPLLPKPEHYRGRARKP